MVVDRVGFEATEHAPSLARPKDSGKEFRCPVCGQEEKIGLRILQQLLGFAVAF